MTGKKVSFWIVYIILDVICAGMGMGVPLFCIVLGFPVGFHLAGKWINDDVIQSESLKVVFRKAVIASGITFGLMLAIWGRSIFLLFDPAFDVANFGHPLILFDPGLSFIGWLVLMIFISPFLQFLTTIAGAYFTFMRIKKLQEYHVKQK